MNNQCAEITDIYRGTTHDGPGLRDTVFIKGCPLNCRWCHNPEAISFQPEIWWESRTCIGCETCVRTCPNSALSLSSSGLEINRTLCRACSVCTYNCPTASIVRTSKPMNTGEVFEEVKKDLLYFKTFHGGVTLSGGECLSHPDYVVDLLSLLKNEGIHTAVDTSGFVPKETLEKILPLTDCILYDIKLWDSQLHYLFTGKGNELIKSNLHYLIEERQNGNHSFSIWIRTPLIPDATATEENIRSIARFLSQHLGTAIERWEMCAFNNACKDKYSKLGKDWYYKDYRHLNASEAEELRAAAVQEGCPGDRVALTGIMT